jgi:hypothetical protein
LKREGSAGNASVLEEILRGRRKPATARVEEDKNAYVFLTFHVLTIPVRFCGLAIDADLYSFLAELLIRPVQARLNIANDIELLGSGWCM